MLEIAGCRCWRVGFNAADKVFWRPSSKFISFKEPYCEWPATFRKIVTDKSITDLVLYGDTREIHQRAISEARKLNIEVHVFEEGYLRPYWVTYERGGSNENSRLMQMPLKQMQSDLTDYDLEAPMPPSHWGDTRQHVFYGALYHWFIMFANRAFPHFKPHRAILHGHRPLIFGQPFYAGWGLSKDISPPPRRNRKLNAEQLFMATMMIYSKWYDPYRDQLCSLERALDTFEAITRSWREDHKGWQAHKIRMWKRKPMRQFFGQHARISFVSSMATAKHKASARNWFGQGLTA